MKRKSIWIPKPFLFAGQAVGCGTCESCRWVGIDDRDGVKAKFVVNTVTAKDTLSIVFVCSISGNFKKIGVPNEVYNLYFLKKKLFFLKRITKINCKKTQLQKWATITIPNGKIALSLFGMATGAMSSLEQYCRHSNWRQTSVANWRQELREVLVCRWFV